MAIHGNSLFGGIYEMDGGSGKEIRYDRNTGDFTGYGNEASE